MWEEYNLKLIIEAQDKFSAELKNMKWQIEDVQVAVKNSTKKMSDWATSFWNAFGKIKNVIWWLAIASVFSKWISVIWDATKKVQEYEWQIERLRTLTANSTWATKSMTDELIRQAEAIDKVWVATKDWIVSAQAQFATFDMSTQAIQKLIPAFTDYVVAEKWASASTEDYISMANGLAQALNGNYASLTRTWFILDEETKKIIENGNEMERVQAIVEVLNSTYEWFNEKLSTTAEWMANIRAKEREDELQAIAEKTRWLYETFDEAKTLFVNMLWSLAWVTTKTNDEVSLLKDNIWKLKDAVAELDAEYKTWKISASEYLQETKKLNEETKTREKELKNEESWLIKVEKAEKELEIATINVKKAYKEWRITLEEATKAYAEIEKQQQRLISAEKLWAWATQQQMDMLTELRWIQDKVKETTKQLADAEKEYASLKADKSATKSELDAMKSKVDSLKTSLYQLRDAEKTVLNSVTPFAPIQNNVSPALLQQYAEQLTQSFIVPKTSWGWGGWGWGWWGSWSGSKSKSTQQVEELGKALESTIKEMNQYAQESEKMRKATYEWIIDAMDEASEKASKLADEIVDLKKDIDELWVSETKDIASAYIKAEETLKNYKKDYEWIVDLANEFTKEELKGKSDKWTINWYSAKDLLEVKDAVESTTSAFAWLDEEQTKQLQKQIEDQKAYNELNSVDKIKADYEAKRQVLQTELDEKVKAFEKESKEFLINELKKEIYEKKWLDYMKYSVTEQKKMTDQLIWMYERLARAKEDAWMWWWIEWKATWWDVYQNTPYIVGEKWPELFVPKTNGTIIPNNQITNNNWIEINLNWLTVRSQADIEAITDEIIRKIKLEKTFWIS